jgi:hypothetical protein
VYCLIPSIIPFKKKIRTLVHRLINLPQFTNLEVVEPQFNPKTYPILPLKESDEKIKLSTKKKR